MSTNRTRRPAAKRAPGSALLANERPPMPTLTAPTRPAQAEIVQRPVEPEELEEVVVEPDLPVEEPEPPTPREVYEQLVAAMPADEPVYVAGNRAPALKVGDYTLAPGEVVPGAHGWARREAYERLGRIERR